MPSWSWSWKDYCAFDELRSIRLYKDKPLPILNRKKHYENFARVLWHGYKDLWSKVAGLLGYNIGFVFQREANFNQSLEAFVSQNQSQLLLDVREFLTRQRTNWQHDLATFAMTSWNIGTQRWRRRWTGSTIRSGPTWCSLQCGEPLLNCSRRSSIAIHA